VQELAVEVAGQRRSVGGVQGAAGDQHAVEVAAALLAVLLHGNPPALAFGDHGQYPGIELVMLVEAEVPSVILEVALQLRVVRVGGHPLVHGELTELGHPLRGNQMRGFVHGAVGVVDIPQTAHVAVQFIADEGQTLFTEISCRGQAHRAGTDHCVHG
jgi:hypothetical protein